jgi:hypothetical protein
VQAQRLGDLVADGEHRVERGHRLLEDHRDAVAADRAHPAATGATATTAVATATAATAAEATATAATTASRALLGLVHAQRTAVEHLPVHALDGLLGLLRRAHGDEAEATGAAGLAVAHQVDVRHRAELFERSADGLGGRVERKVANVQTGAHLDLAILWPSSHDTALEGPTSLAVRSQSCNHCLPNRRSACPRGTKTRDPR